jgi:serine phosphatase RsbU (regulator of sigma subunit)
MDLSVITIDKTENTVEFAGAKNPAIYIQNGELFVLKADKMPIGGEQREQERIFSKTTIDISQPTTFYLFSDGYQDQFGGENDKKFMLATMKKMFLEIANLPMTEQQQIITTTFEQWKEGREQTDDVLVMGLKI